MLFQPNVPIFSFFSRGLPGFVLQWTAHQLTRHIHRTQRRPGVFGTIAGIYGCWFRNKKGSGYIYDNHISIPGYLATVKIIYVIPYQAIDPYYLICMYIYIPSGKLTLLNVAIYSGFCNQKWWFSMVMLVYQRVYVTNRDLFSDFLITKNGCESSWFLFANHQR